MLSCGSPVVMSWLSTQLATLLQKTGMNANCSSAAQSQGMSVLAAAAAAAAAVFARRLCTARTTASRVTLLKMEFDMPQMQESAHSNVSSSSPT